MQVAYIVSRFPVASETFVIREVDALHQQGLAIELFSLFKSKQEYVHPISRNWEQKVQYGSLFRGAVALPVVIISKPKSFFSSLGKLIFHMYKNPVQLVKYLYAITVACGQTGWVENMNHIHAHFATYPALAAWFWHRLTGIPYSFTVHAYDLFRDQSLLALLMKDAKFVVTISKYNQRLLEKYQPKDKVPIKVIHAGIVPNNYVSSSKVINARSKLRVICVARLIETKGHKTILEALALSHPQLPEITVDFVGDGPQKIYLTNLADQLGLTSQVTFHGTLSEGEVNRLLGQADLFILPSTVEGIPVVLMEAMAKGLPVITTGISGIPELVKDQETGFTVKPNDPQALRAKIATVVTNSAVTEQVASKARKLIEEEFDVEQSAQRLFTLFTSN